MTGNTTPASPFKEYLLAFLAVLGSGLICFPLAPAIGYQVVGLIFLALVAGLSLFLGRGPVLMAAVLNFTVWNYFFIPPIFTFHVFSLHDSINLFANLLVALVGGTLIHRIRKNQIKLKQSQEDTSVLYSLLQALNNTTSIRDVVGKARQEMQKQFNADAAIYLRGKDFPDLDRKAFGNTEYNSDEEYQAARWCFRQQAVTGKFTQSNEHAALQYFPLVVPRGIIGVAGLVFIRDRRPGLERYSLLEAFIKQIALSLEREINIDLVKQNQIVVESERLFQTVLNSVSHELKTPISIITAATANLNNGQTAGNPSARKQICEELNTASMRLNFIVENILDMSRIESGILKLKLEYCDISDLFGIVVHELKAELARHRVVVDCEENMAFIRADIKLLKQALKNVIHNAVVYTPQGTLITLQARRTGPGGVCITISDEGEGVPEAYLKKLFNKFFRLPGAKSGGTGLGLAITKAVAEAHKGSISAMNNKEGGLSIVINLPAGD